MSNNQQTLSSTEHKAIQMMNDLTKQTTNNEEEQRQLITQTGKQNELETTSNNESNNDNDWENKEMIKEDDNNNNTNENVDDNNKMSVDELHSTSESTKHKRDTNNVNDSSSINNSINKNEDNNYYNNSNNTNKLRSNQFSWRCGACGYHVLAMDQNGKPLPLLRSAFQEILPLTCPRCTLTHTDWTSSSPFNSLGDHVNIRSRLANRTVNLLTDRTTDVNSMNNISSITTTLQNSTMKNVNNNNNNNNNNNLLQEYSHLSHVNALMYPSKHDKANRPIADDLHDHNNHTIPTTTTPESLELMPREFNHDSHIPTHKIKNIYHVSTPVKRKETKYSFYCGYCQRRLLRLDMNGEVIAMDLDSTGQPLPITCPGCQRTHSEWTLKPFKVNSTMSSKQMDDQEKQQSKEKEKEEQLV